MYIPHMRPKHQYKFFTMRVFQLENQNHPVVYNFQMSIIHLSDLHK